MKTKLKIEGMHCTSCAMSIDFDLEDLDGVISAKTSYAREEIEVEFEEGSLKIEQVIEQIKKTGYKAAILL